MGDSLTGWSRVARVGALAILLMVVWSVQAKAQTGTVTLTNGTRLHGAVLLYVPGQRLVLEVDGQTQVLSANQLAGVELETVQAPVPDARPSSDGSFGASPRERNGTLSAASSLDYVRAIELNRLRVRRELQRSANRAWQLPAIALGVGISSLLAGAVVYATAWNGGDDDDTCWDCTGYSVPMDRAGLVLMPVGAAIVAVTAPMFIVRAVRGARLRRTERAISGLEGLLALSPLLVDGRVGLSGSIRF